MKNKKIFMYLIIIVLILFVLWIGILIIKNKNNQKKWVGDDYTPEEEISMEQLRKTNINLYFYDEKEQILKAEIKQIDSKELLIEPEKKLIQFLIEGPKNNNLKRLIPEETKILGYEKNGDLLIINFSNEFINEEIKGKELEKNIIQSILKTASQLNEINRIKILIDGEENKSFYDNEINFSEIFIN